ncbi:MAG TPA: DinB family protein, partial [Nitrolancea sp.]|nr:DinB family protein [Nitrolancea sp.]
MKFVRDQKGKRIMQTLLDLARYNAWANQRVFETSAALSSAVLSAEAKGTYGSVQETLAHLVEVEEIYLLMLRDANIADWDTDRFMANSPGGFAERSRGLGDDYRSLVETHDENWLNEQFVVPWF